MSWITFGMLNHNMLGKIIFIYQNHVKNHFSYSWSVGSQNLQWTKKDLIDYCLHDMDRIKSASKMSWTTFDMLSCNILGKSIAAVYQNHVNNFFLLIFSMSFIEIIIDQESACWLQFTNTDN